MEAKHTPGPRGISEGDNCPCVYSVTADADVAYVVSHDASSDPEADARLIAAAPDMYEALRALFDECVMAHRHWGDGDNTQAANAAAEAGKAALAKAESR